MRTKSNDVYAYISGGCFAAIALLCIYNSRVAFRNPVVLFQNGNFPTLVFWGVLISFAVFLFLRKRGLGLVIVSGIELLRQIYFVFSRSPGSSFYAVYAVEVLLYAISFLYILLCCTKTLEKKAPWKDWLWFAPSTLGVIQFVMYLCGGLQFRSVWHTLFLAVAHLFLGVWLNGGWSLPSRVASHQTLDNTEAPSTFSVPAIEATPVFGSADKLLQYKALLDSGILTQEEFDAKKKQLLGL